MQEAQDHSSPAVAKTLTNNTKGRFYSPQMLQFKN